MKNIYKILLHLTVLVVIFVPFSVLANNNDTDKNSDAIIRSIGKY